MESLKKKKSNNNKKLQIGLKETEWIELIKIEDFLEPFYEATNILSSSKTTNQRDFIFFELKTLRIQFK